MKLHKTDKARVLWGDDLEYQKGLLDKTETLYMRYREGLWYVSIQKNGLRLKNFAVQSQARRYMAYMLEHAGKELREIPVDPKGALKYFYSSVLFEVSKKACFIAIQGED